MTYICKIKKNMWDIINISECERRNEIDSASVSIIFGTAN